MLSRVADSLYWLSRYLERAEHTARLANVYFELILDQSSQAGNARFQKLRQNLHVPDTPDTQDLDDTLDWIILDEENAASIASCVRQARENARQVREQISSETWTYINQIYLTVNKPPRRWYRQPQTFLLKNLEQLHLVTGVVDSTMSHNEGWQFMRLGRYIERSLSILTVVETQFDTYIESTSGPEEYLDWIAVLKSCTAFEAYCKVYTADMVPAHVAEYLLLDAEFPHSLHFSINMIRNALEQIAQLTKSQRNRQLNRKAGRLQSLLQFSQINEIMEDDLQKFLTAVRQQCHDIHENVYQVYISFPAIEELPT